MTTIAKLGSSIYAVTITVGQSLAVPIAGSRFYVISTPLPLAIQPTGGTRGVFWDGMGIDLAVTNTSFQQLQIGTPNGVNSILLGGTKVFTAILFIGFEESLLLTRAKNYWREVTVETFNPIVSPLNALIISDCSGDMYNSGFAAGLPPFGPISEPVAPGAPLITVNGLGVPVMPVERIHTVVNNIGSTDLIVSRRVNSASIASVTANSVQTILGSGDLVINNGSTSINAYISETYGVVPISVS